MAVLGAVGNAVGQEFLKYVSDFNLQQINNIVEEFKKTGKIKLPKGSKAAELSTRFAITTAITRSYKTGEIDRHLFEDFLSNLEPEERASVRKVLAESDSVISENENYTFLEADLDNSSLSMLVNDESVFVQKEGMAELVSADGKDREVVNYVVKKGSRAVSIKRGTDSKFFIAGSLVKPL
jgi:hypothetical protein